MIRLIFFLWAVGMTYIGGLIAPEGILSDISSMIPDPLKGASNEDKVQVAGHQFGIHGRTLNELIAEIAR